MFKNKTYVLLLYQQNSIFLASKAQDDGKLSAHDGAKSDKMPWPSILPGFMLRSHAEVRPSDA
jgi:hypothetical protein